MERLPNRPDEHPDDADEYPSGTEEPTETPGVDPDSQETQPGFSDDPPQAD